MSTAPNPKDGTVRRRRLKADQPKGWKAVPTPVKILAPICIAVLVLIPLAKEEGWFKHRAAAPVAAAPTAAFNPGLQIVEAHLDEASRTIRGSVHNSADRPYGDVHISYDLRDNGFRNIGIVEVTIPQVKPNETVPFSTDPVHAQGEVLWALREIYGSPR